MKAKHLYEFGTFRLDTSERLLLLNGKAVLLNRKAYETLLLLVQNNGRVVEKEEFIKIIWADTFVEDGSLTVNISVLRKALGQDQSGAKYIETIPHHGYRFVATVREVSEEVDAAAVEKGHATPRPPEEERANSLTANADTEPAHTASLPHIEWRGWAWPRLLFVGIAAVGLTAAFAYFRLANESNVAERGAKIKSIAVLPLKPIGMESDAALGLSIADAVITEISSLHEITVRPTSDIRKYADSGQNPLVVGREMGVDAILDGSVQRAGDQIRVTAQLTCVKGGGPLWTKKFDEKFTHLFIVEDSIAKQIAQALKLKLNEDEQKRR